MAYATYITEALVCGTRNRNTADRSYLMFTREAGMLFADARSVREERSRQRYALQDFSLVRVTLIKGKSGWRIGSVEALSNYYNQAEDKAARGSVVKLVRLLRRFVHGEETHRELFDYLKDALEVLSVQTEKRSFVEDVIQLELLRMLGYVDVKRLPEELRDIHPTKVVLLNETSMQKSLEKLLKTAVSVSHL